MSQGWRFKIETAVGKGKKMKKFKAVAVIFAALLSQNSIAACHYFKHHGNNFYYTNENGDVYDFSIISKNAPILGLTGVNDNYNLLLEHVGGDGLSTIFSCKNGCSIITESVVRYYGFMNGGQLVYQKQVIRNKKTVLGSAMTDYINGCMSSQEKKDKAESKIQEKEFFEEMQPSRSTVEAFKRLSKLPDSAATPYTPVH